MAAPVDQPLIAALDIGSSKVGALICSFTDDGRLQVLGTGQRESRGVKRGFITETQFSDVLGLLEETRRTTSGLLRHLETTEEPTPWIEPPDAWG